ncbi:hypothetical protein ANTRET_LOCUS10399 [Anthophora retusa]
MRGGDGRGESPNTCTSNIFAVFKDMSNVLRINFIADRSKVVGHRGKDGTDGNGTAMKTEKRVSCWKSPTAVANGRREKRRRKGERGEGRARMLRASPFCLNVVYAVARQQPLRSIHI